MTASKSETAVAERPRVVLWIGPHWRVDEALLADLPKLALAAVYMDGVEPDVALALRGTPGGTGRKVVVLSTVEEVENWDPATIPLFRLRSDDDGPRPGIRARNRRSAMYEQFKRVAEDQRVSMIAVGFGDDAASLAEALEVAAEYGTYTPSIVAGAEGEIAELRKWSEAESGSGFPAPQYLVGDWQAVVEQLSAAGIPLLLDVDDEPCVKVGRYVVPVLPIFEDPGARIDRDWRVPTVKALRGAPGAAHFERAFHAVMQLDEARDAASITDDYYEGWGIVDGVLATRPPFRSALDGLLGELRSLFGEYRKPRTCWVAAEPGSGTTLFLHRLAYAVAEAGFPVLFAKQHLRSADERAVSDFLLRLRDEAARIAGAHGDTAFTEQPVLLVLDVQQNDVPEMDELPDYLVRRSGRPVLTLRAARIPAASQAPAHGPTTTWLAERMTATRGSARHDGASPSPTECVLAHLCSVASPEEIRLVAAHAQQLRDHRGLELYSRSLESWQTLQEKHPLHLQTFLGRLGLPPGELERARAAFEGKDLFWVVLHHFLSTQPGPDEVDPLRHVMRGKVARFSELARSHGFDPEYLLGLALEVAKTTLWGIPMPVTALVDWSRAVPSQPVGSDTVAGVTEPGLTDAPRKLTEAELGSAVDLLRAWASGERRLVGSRRPETPELRTNVALDILAEEGLLRRHVLTEAHYATIPHGTLAKYLLLQAHEDHDELPARLRDALGDVQGLYDPDRAVDMFARILQCLTSATANVHLCEDLSEKLLLGRDDSPEWADARGERRMEAYERIPEDIITASRVLIHHRALVMRRTTFNKTLASAVKATRLEEARRHLEQALAMPWEIGERSDHPSFIRTTLGLVLRSLADVKPEQRQQVRAAARAALGQALLDMPSSRHTRLALGRICLEDAVDERTGGDMETAVRLAGECLHWLSVDPTGMQERWHDIKKQAAALFDDSAGQRYLEELCSRGVEDGFLLRAEIMLSKGGDGIRQALDLLRPRVDGRQAINNVRTCRRVAELLEQAPDGAPQYAERYRLLRVVETAGVALSAVEEFHVAAFAFQIGEYEEGVRRFNLFRARGRASQVAGAPHLFMVAPGKPELLKCRGRVISSDEGRGWMQLEREEDGQRLFRAPFTARHFRDRPVSRGAQFPGVIVRITENGPQVVPARFVAAA